MAAAPGTAATVAPQVRFGGLTTILDDTPVLHGLDLTVAPGEITVLMGPSGAGKSTLVRHLAGLLKPDAGTVQVGDEDVWRATEGELRALRRRMSVMLGGSSLYESSLFASLSALDNVRYGLGSRGIPRTIHDELAMARLLEVGLGDEIERFPAELPAHARKRLALARALVVDAPLLVVDEIEVGLDSVHRDGVIRALVAQHRRTGCTMLVTTHDICLARELGDTLAVLCNSHIVARGPAADLLRGVETSEDFDHRFRISDFLGPPRLADARAAVEARDRGRTRGYAIDENVLWFGLAGLILVAMLVALLTVGPPAPF
ncbi:MAG: ABC transporter ATP-binding protein [Pseudonocardia sp.]